MLHDGATLPVLRPDLQISFYARFKELEAQYLQAALKVTIERSDNALVDRQLAEFVNLDSTRRVASFGLRGEVFFAVPCLLTANPMLLGYYRLLLGFSQKEFYNKGPFGKFRRLEFACEIPGNITPQIDNLCRSLTASAEILVDGIEDLSLSMVRDLQILTLGPQLRGSRNTQLGQDATQEVFELIKHMVAPSAIEVGTCSIELKNDSGRIVMIEFAADPDIRIVELLPSGPKPRVSIAIKGGGDRSNIHNRIGEAEKSHQKARSQGFFEFWTILRAQVDLPRARRESPTKSHFFNLDAIKDPDSHEHDLFRDLLASMVGIRI